MDSLLPPFLPDYLVNELPAITGMLASPVVSTVFASWCSGTEALRVVALAAGVVSDQGWLFRDEAGVAPFTEEAERSDWLKEGDDPGSCVSSWVDGVLRWSNTRGSGFCLSENLTLR